MRVLPNLRNDCKILSRAEYRQFQGGRKLFYGGRFLWFFAESVEFSGWRSLGKAIVLVFKKVLGRFENRLFLGGVE